jgi:hypothetical protein
VVLFHLPGGRPVSSGVWFARRRAVTAVAGRGSRWLLSKQPAGWTRSPRPGCWRGPRSDAGRPAGDRVRAGVPVRPVVPGRVPAVVGGCAAYFAAAGRGPTSCSTSGRTTGLLPGGNVHVAAALGLLTTYPLATSPFGIGAFAAAGAGLRPTPRPVACGRRPPRSCRRTAGTHDAARRRTAVAPSPPTSRWPGRRSGPLVLWAACAAVGSFVVGPGVPALLHPDVARLVAPGRLTLRCCAPAGRPRRRHDRRRLGHPPGRRIGRGPVPAGAAWARGTCHPLFAACLWCTGWRRWCGRRRRSAAPPAGDAPVARVARTSATGPAGRADLRLGFNPEIYTLSAGRRPAVLVLHVSWSA